MRIAEKLPTLPGPDTGHDPDNFNENSSERGKLQRQLASFNANGHSRCLLITGASDTCASAGLPTDYRRLPCRAVPPGDRRCQPVPGATGSYRSPIDHPKVHGGHERGSDLAGNARSEP
jgi:hypothetical protein